MADRDPASTTSRRKQKAQWRSDVEQKLIETWVHVLERFGGAMVKKRAKAKKAADLLNEYARTEVPGVQYTADEVLAKVNNIAAKAKKSYCQ